MKFILRNALLAGAFILSNCLDAQISIGGKVGVNYLIGSQEIQPEPKNAPTNPKGLGLSFAAFAGIPFSDLVGIRPELGFSFRKGKSESSDNQSLTNNTDVTGGQGAYTGSRDNTVESDQRLSYFQVNVPLTLSPSGGLRVMLGPSFNFLMGGKQNVDETTTWKGNVTGQDQQGQQVTQAIDQQDFETTKKKGGAAIKDFKKADIMVLAGVGYTLPVGLDMDLRYYRGLSTTYDHSAGSSRQRIWSNLVELSVGWAFGGK
jgi:hypothetical protein